MTVSVLIPVYNTADYLSRCLDSLLAQKTPPDEILLVDDGSDDGRTAALCDDYERLHPELIRVIHTPNRGVAEARNTCIEKAKGDYLLFVDSDDYASPELISTLLPYTERGIDVVVFPFLIDEDGLIRKPSEETLPFGALTTLRETPELMFAVPAPWNKLWRKGLIVDTGIRFPSKILFEDLATTARLLASACQIAVIEEPLYYYTERKGSIMRRRKPERDRDVMKAMDCLTDWFQKAGLFTQYEKELEALTVQHVLLAASVRVARADPDSPVLGELSEYTEKHYPAWRMNLYVSRLHLKHRLLLRLIRRKRYKLISLLFAIKDCQKEKEL